MTSKPLPTQVLIDTNMLLTPQRFGVDIFTEIERICDFPLQLAVLSTTIAELNKINERNDASGRAARLGLQLIKAKDLYIIPCAPEQNVDDALVVYAAKHKGVVATSDKALIQRLLAKNVRVIMLIGKKYLKLG